MRRLGAAGAAVLALAGCGDALDEFRNELRPLEDRAAQQRAEIAVDLRGVHLGSRADARVLRRRSAELKRTFAEIAELDAPEGYDEPFEDYVRANTRMVRGLDRFAAAVAAGRAGGLRGVSGTVVRGLGESQRARLRWLE